MPSVPFAKALEPAAQLFKRLTIIKAAEAKVTVGVDIGSTAIKVIALGPRRGAGPRPIIGQNLVPLTAGQEVDPSEAVKASVGVLKVPIRSVNLAVSGQWVIMRIVEMPTMKPAEMKQALPFEAQRYLPFDIKDVIIDGVALGPADANKTWVLIVACKKELIERRIDWVKRAGLSAALIDVDALALANAMLASRNGQRRDGTRALINVGAQLTNLVIFKEQIPYLVRDIPWGGEKLARSVAEQMSVDLEAAKKELEAASPAPEFLSVVKTVSELLATELQLSFDYFENRFGHPPDEVLASGGLGQSALFLEGLKSHLAQAVSPWAPVDGLSGQFAVAYGLALRSD